MTSAKLIGIGEHIDYDKVFENLRTGKINAQVLNVLNMNRDALYILYSDLIQYIKSYQSTLIEYNSFRKNTKLSNSIAKNKKSQAQLKKLHIALGKVIFGLTTAFTDFYEVARMFFIFKLTTPEIRQQLISNYLNISETEQFKICPKISSELQILIGENLSQLSTRFFLSPEFKTIQPSLFKKMDELLSNKKIKYDPTKVFNEKNYNALRIFRNYVSHGDSVHTIRCLTLSTIKDIETICTNIYLDLNAIDAISVNRLPIDASHSSLSKSKSSFQSFTIEVMLQNFYKG